MAAISNLTGCGGVSFGERRCSKLPPLTDGFNSRISFPSTTQLAVGYLSKTDKKIGVRMALVNERVVQSGSLAKASEILTFELVQGALVKWSSFVDKSLPEPPTAVFLHGILGSRKNWGTFTRRLAQEFPTWQFLLVDLRCHGDSASVKKTGPNTVSSTALDVLKLVRQLRITPRVLVGHSFGGKVALSMVEQAAKPLARPVRVWVLDSTPGKVRPGGDGEDHPAELISVLSTLPKELVIDAFQSIYQQNMDGRLPLLYILATAAHDDDQNIACTTSPPFSPPLKPQRCFIAVQVTQISSPTLQLNNKTKRSTLLNDATIEGQGGLGFPFATLYEKDKWKVSSKRDVVQALVQKGFSKDVAQWVVTNLRPSGPLGSTPSTFSWTFDLNGISEMYQSYEETNLWKLVEDVPRGVHVNFLKAERSLHRWALEDLQRIHAAEELAAEEGGGVEMHVLEDAGHWVHADNPDGLFRIISSSFR